MEQDAQPSPDRLIVVGASAGGIEAISALLRSLPPDLAAPIVIAQHLNPSRESHLDAILGRNSPLPVRVAVEGERLQAGVVYVVPSNRDIEIAAGAIFLHEPGDRRPVPSIDRLLRSAAHEMGENLVAVILSGSGSDGAAGARDVKAAGGMVIAQEPESASFPSMPLSLALSTVDAVAEPREIGPLLGDVITGEFVERDPGHEQQLRLLLEQLQQRSGIDFKAYKRPTVLRRLKSRMAATGQPTLADYLHHLDGDPEEYGRLTASFLIKVTEFFRDPNVMEHLRSRVLPEVVAHARTTREFRVWCAGCSTGEEAYTMAMLVVDALGDDRDGIDVRIFATDIDAAALTFARRGVYGAAAVRNMSPALLRRHFVPVGDGYEVSKDVRSLVIFGEHDLGVRPPFPHLDLVLCRNVLIYFTSELQRRVLKAFAYALRPDGWLVLGNSESAAALGEVFIAERAAVKIYRREGQAVIAPPRLATASLIDSARRPRGVVPLPRPASPPPHPTPRPPEDQVDPTLRELPVGVVTVGPRYETLRINPAARRLLAIHGPALGEDFIHLAEALPAGSVRTALKAAFKGEVATAVHRSTTLDPATGAPLGLEVTSAPLRALPGAPVAGAVILVADVTPATIDREAVTGVRARLDQTLEASGRLLAANAELTEANDLLRIANDTLVIGAEDALAAREDAETLTEELQASNEELETLNEELQASVEELNVSNEDLAARTNELVDGKEHLARERDRMESILDGISDAVLAFDPEGRPVSWNRAYLAVFGDPATPFVPEDETGEPLPPEGWPQELARLGESFSADFSVGATDGSRRWYEARGTALKERSHEWASVMVIRDVSDRSLRRLQARFMAAAAHEVRTPIAALHGYLQLLVRRLDPQRDEKTAEYAISALAQTRHLAELSDRLFDVSFMAGRRLSLEREPIDLVALCGHVAETENVLAGDAATVALQTRRRRLVVDADAGRVEQVLFNLVANALVHGTATRVKVRVRRIERWAEIAVIDDGRGIPADELPRLFARYSNVGQSHRAARVGLGLGLFLAHEIVALHGGTIEAISKEGRGTTIIVRLPLPAGRTRG